MTHPLQLGTIVVMTLGGVKCTGFIKASRKALSNDLQFYDVQVFDGILYTNVVINEKLDWIQVYDANKHG